jgi:hypothetical protein
MSLIMFNDEVLNEGSQCLWTILDVFPHLLQVVLAHLLQQVDHLLIAADQLVGNELARFMAVLHNVL